MIIMKKLNILLVFLIFFIKEIQSFDIKIGAIFDQNYNESELLFNIAINTMNNDPKEFRLGGVIHEIQYGYEFEVSKKLCRIFRNGVAAIFGPSASSSASHAINICDAKEIPYIDTKWDGLTKPPVINMHPHPDIMIKLILDLVDKWEWEGFTILYESATWLPRMSELLKLYDPKGSTVTVRKIDLGVGDNYRSVLRRVKLSNDFNIIIDCSVELLPEVLKQAQQVGLLTDSHQIIITTLDMHVIDLEPYQYSGTNITGIRMVNFEDPVVKQVTEAFENEMEKINEEYEVGSFKLNLQGALIYDGVLLLTEALKQLDIENNKPIKVGCNNEETWEYGHSVSNFMRTTVVQGLTGEVKFDNLGLRSQVVFDVVELGSAGLIKVGTWNSTEGLNITREYETGTSIDDGSLRNKTFIVLTSLTPPYGMLKDSALQLSGNDRFEGFGIDLIHELSLMLGFNYIFQLQEDGVYGSINNETKQWTGMIRELLDGRADLAITDLTITSERESAVDFTMPFMNLGISILFQKPRKDPPSTFSFMSPFSTEVWMYLGGAYLGVSVCLFILGRISPSEWDNPYPCIEEPTELVNQFSLRNALWFTMGALLQQGSEIAPKAPSTRAVASIWWFFTLIMVSSYTANLAAFLTVESVSQQIKSAEDLKQCGESDEKCPVRFGAKKEGSTINFFKEAEHGTYKSMYKYMVAHPEYLTKDNEKGLEWANEGGYAFLMESSSIEYLIERNCDVTQVGGLLDDKGYGIAMRKHSSYRSALSEGVLKLQEQGRLTALKTKWWKEKKGGGACSDDAGDSGAVALEVANVEGVFLLLLLGTIIAFVLNICEFCLSIRQRAVENKKKSSGSESAEELNMENMYGIFIVLLIGSFFASWYGFFEWLIIIYKHAKLHKVPFRDELMAELKFVIQCHGNTKKIRYRKSNSNDSRHSATTYRSNRSKYSEI